MRTALRRRDAATRTTLGPSMTPMVDVVLVILVFFMATASVAGPEWFLGAAIPSWAPSTASANEAAPAGADNEQRAILPEARLEVRLLRAGGQTLATGLGVSGVGLDRLAEAAAALGQRVDIADAIVVVIPSGDVPYEDVVRVHDACLGAGLTRVAIIGE
ncbi:MAG: biopolymer transporter ExbD [Planctomycetota bacterium]